MDNLAFFTAAFFTGMAKAGMGALGSLATPILLMPLPDPRTAVGLGTLIFFLGDLGAVAYYLRSARLGILVQVLPISASGMLVAFIVGKHIPLRPYMLCITILSGLAFILLLQSKYRKKKFPSKDSEKSRVSNFFFLSLGFVAGFTTVLGNVSGIFMNLYLSTKKLPKQGFVATMALFYFLVNATKLLVFYFYWQSLDLSILRGWLPILGILLCLVLGLVIGIFTVHKMTEKIFSLFVVLASLLSFVLLLWRSIAFFMTP